MIRLVPLVVHLLSSGPRNPNESCQYRGWHPSKSRAKEAGSVERARIAASKKLNAAATVRVVGNARRAASTVFIVVENERRSNSEYAGIVAGA